MQLYGSFASPSFDDTRRALDGDGQTDGAFVAAARAAEASGNPDLHAEIVAELELVHPGSPLARQM